MRSGENEISADAAPSGARRLPGEEGVWMFVLGDLLVFALFFATYLGYRAADPAGYADAQATLNTTIGLANTLALLTSSAAVALGVKALRSGGVEAARAAWRWTMAAILLGLAFVAGKIIEYTEKFSAGVGVETSEFFMFFFMLTGIHLVHVLVGLGVLGALLAMLGRAREAPIDATGRRWAECAGIFWHMVDLLWIVLFTLFYLLR